MPVYNKQNAGILFLLETWLQLCFYFLIEIFICIECLLMLNRKRVYNIYIKNSFNKVFFRVRSRTGKNIQTGSHCLFLAGMGLYFSYKDKSMPYNLFIWKFIFVVYIVVLNSFDRIIFLKEFICDNTIMFWNNAET